MYQVRKLKRSNLLNIGPWSSYFDCIQFGPSIFTDISRRSKISQFDLPNVLLFANPLPPTSIGYPNDNFPLVSVHPRRAHVLQKIGDCLTKIAGREQDAAPLK
jgi:hypothetical protein